jgi:membrane protease YdiL (CAAX protease family)
MITRGQHLTSLLTPAAILLGCAALATRPPATLGALGVLVAVGAIGVLTPLPSSRLDARTDARGSLAIIALGVLAFALARAIAAPLPAPVTPLVLGATVTAAVAEEVFFRRLVYGWLAHAGLAIVGAAALFAIVHLPAYGARVLPLDLAAGMLFGWQRRATGRWIAPALTHAAANVLQLL